MKKKSINHILGNGVIPSKIKEARESRGLSLSELSERIGVSSQAISQYELGTSNPSGIVFMKIIDVLDFPSTFFYKDYEKNTYVSNSVTYFRGNKNTTKKVKRALKIRINWIDKTYSHLKRYFDLPQLDIPNFDDLLIDSELNILDVEAIVERLREYWNVGDAPIPNMIDLLQEKGFVISKLQFNNKKVDAFSRWYNGTPYIILGSDKNSAVRSRFDLAHELGHLIMHRNINEDDLSKKDVLNRVEREADWFAASFLIPIKSFNKEVISSSINHFIILKQRWKVSISSMIRRCEDANILTDNQIRYLKSQMIKNGYYRREPLDDLLKSENPYLFKQGFSMLIENNIMNKTELLDLISLNSREAEKLFCLDENFFQTNIATISINENKIYSYNS
ncbi:helix-turn-helix domain-containing protein [Clostridium algidicarnis]|uniref:helix-turn-helix domain-containing protein n=1 Tax=Clostridium algidicarnis TaxID=37659 RepID=UPI003FD80FC1